MDAHVQLGLEFLQQLLGQHKIPDQLAIRRMANFIGMHHEHLEGSCYSHGLCGEAIPLERERRVAAVTNVFDAPTTTSPCRWGISVSEGSARLNRLAINNISDSAFISALGFDQESLEMEFSMPT